MRGILQRQRLDLVDALVEADAQFGHQCLCQRRLVLQQVQIGLVGQAEELGRRHCLGGGDVVGGVHECHGFCEGVAVADHFEDFFLSLGGKPVDLYAAGNHEIERVGRLALAEHVVALVEVEQIAVGEQVPQMVGAHGFEEGMG
ncbi:hypothetical protein D3C81_1366580 [compost metagenome]